ncbi:putative reverse transcriptase domain-containing protein [Tanacetum coccineum]|uniref:Reverse transcriptase domain-containing protein n=1 Tax=Tanacetum coccineum TaxID=301880 RepID=A0ABQ5FKC9_9ASTR
MTDKYCRRGEITRNCIEFVANETEKVDKYISGLPDNIYGNVKSSRPKTLDETIELANDLMDQKLRTYAESRRQQIGRLMDLTVTNSSPSTKPFKRLECRQGLQYGGRNATNVTSRHLPAELQRFWQTTNVANAQRDNRAVPKGNGCFECGAPGHFKRDCPKLKNKDVGNGNAQGWVYAVGNAREEWECIEEHGPLCRSYDSGFDIAPTPLLENSYDVELADGKIVGIDTIIRGCTLNFLNHPFNIDLMPVELGSFDVIIGMDWLRRCHAVIVCDEKLVRIPYGNETLIFCGDKSNNGRESRLTIISCSKAQEYMAKGCQIFLAQISAKKEEDKSEGKQLKDVPIVRDFSEVFPEDLPGLPPARPVEF